MKQLQIKRRVNQVENNRKSGGWKGNEQWKILADTIYAVGIASMFIWGELTLYRAVLVGRGGLYERQFVWGRKSM